VEKERSLRKGGRERELDFGVAMSLLADVYAIKYADKKIVTILRNARLKFRQNVR